MVPLEILTREALIRVEVENITAKKVRCGSVVNINKYKT